MTSNSDGPDSDGPGFDGPGFDGPGFDGPDSDGSPFISKMDLTLSLSSVYFLLF